MTIDPELHPLDAPESDAPEALVRALRALGRERPSAAALSATALRLQARLDAPAAWMPAPAPALGSTAGSTSSAPILLAGRLAAAALAVGLGVTAIALRPAPAPRSVPGASHAAPSATAAALQTVDTQQLPSAQGVAAATTAAAVSGAASPRAASDLPVARGDEPVSRSLPLAAVFPSRLRPVVHPAAPAASLVARTGTGARAAAPQRGSVATAARADAKASSSVSDRASASAGSNSEQAPRPVVAQSELELMLQARKLARTDPAAGLQALAEHARRFPRGLLAPEREVLAIDALRTLGKDEQADARLRAFRATYPDSIHTPGLSRSTR